ncbi:twin-arginine translocation signal domain-containing protein [Synechococcus sp. A10-1-5-9]|uniref:twin-arginine translocation signal domain-containing protein n=1 Tax=Synechococcus sp. A10-1-5-9 TaxID=3392295 RepID=UPI0039E9010E
MAALNSSRRNFLKGAATSASALAIGSSFFKSSSLAAQSAGDSNRKQISVDHEWGTLKEVVVGFTNIRVPSEIPPSSKNYLPQSSIDFIEKNKGQWLIDCDPELNQQSIDQMNTIIYILNDRGVIVHQVEQLSPAEVEYLEMDSDAVMQTFPRDPILVIGNKVIETSMLEPYRRKERFAIRRTIEDRLLNSGSYPVSMPQADPYRGKSADDYGPGPYLEGGDVMLIGKDIYVGQTGNASNLAGIRWLSDYLGQDYQVHQVPLSRRFLHLDCVLALPRPGVAIVCQEAFTQGLPKFLNGWKLINVSADDAEKKMGCNGLVLSKDTILIGDNMPSLKKDLENEGLEVITTPIDALTWQGGGFRCWHHPLVRLG